MQRHEGRARLWMVVSGGTTRGIYSVGVGEGGRDGGEGRSFT